MRLQRAVRCAEVREVNKQLFGIIGLLLAGVGIFLLRLHPYPANTVISTAGSCGMRVDVLGSRSSQASGYVVLFHGLSANKRVMFYIAQAFSNQNLRVFVPDLPGHGTTPGSFSYDRAESCSESLVQDLIDRHAILPEDTLLVGHSLGGAIALRLAQHLPVAGVIAISPAPMRPSPEVPTEDLPYHDFGSLPSRTLVMSGGWEPAPLKAAAQNLLSGQPNASSRYIVIPRATHVSLLFDTRVARVIQSWSAHVLGVEPNPAASPLVPLAAFLFGFAGLAILVVPFLKETVGTSDQSLAPEATSPPRPLAVCIQVAVVSIIVVSGLHFCVPLRRLRIFEGDYLASFFAMGGVALLVWNYRRLTALHFRWRPILGAAFAAVALIMLFGAWLDVSFFEAWLTAARWLRLPFLALFLFPWVLAEEILLGPVKPFSRWRRFLLSLGLRAIVWAAFVAALFALHSGEVLLLLLGAYFAVFFILERLAASLMRRETHSAAAAAVFGAILFAGLALAIFPIA